MESTDTSKNLPDEAGSPPRPMTCRRCGVCCTLHQAFVRPHEIQRIADFLGIGLADWERDYADSRWEYDDYRLIRHIDGACAFLTCEGGLSACLVNPVKPACCSDWAPGPEKKECRRGMETSAGNGR
jgi:hypothetical protein